MTQTEYETLQDEITRDMAALFAEKRTLPSPSAFMVMPDGVVGWLPPPSTEDLLHTLICECVGEMAAKLKAVIEIGEKMGVDGVPERVLKVVGGMLGLNEKDIYTRALRAALKRENASAVIQVMECWFLEESVGPWAGPAKMPKRSLKNVHGRKEAIMTSLEIRERPNWHRHSIQQITRAGDKVTLGPVVTRVADQVDGRMTQVFVDLPPIGTPQQ